MKNGAFLTAADADHSVYGTALPGGEIPDADFIRAEQGNQSLGCHGGTGHQAISPECFHGVVIQHTGKHFCAANDHRYAGKGVSQIVPRVGKSRQSRCFFAKPQEYLKAVIGMTAAVSQQTA